jgi:hypothetical protein
MRRIIPAFLIILSACGEYYSIPAQTDAVEPFDASWEYYYTDSEYCDYTDSLIAETVNLENQTVGTLTYTQTPPNISETGHFTVTGTAQNNCFNYVAVAVSLNSNPKKKNYYFTQSNPFDGYTWKQEIYLRYGAGSYTVAFWRVNDIKADLRGKGFISRIGGVYYSTDTFSVINTKTGATADDWTRLPSEEIQITPEIKDLSDTICAGAINNQEKVKKINKWIVLNLRYDEDSLVDGKRKKQDALYVLRKKLGVCEGYANLTAALARAAGIPARYVQSEPMLHAWLQVFINGSWQMVDTTWNDPVGMPTVTTSNWDSYTRWTEQYLLLSNNTGVNNDHYGGEWIDSRSALGDNQIFPKNAPDGNYILLERAKYD